MSTISESGITELLSARGNLTVRQIADHFNADERRVVELLDGLIDGGWISMKYEVRRVVEFPYDRPAPDA